MPIITKISVQKNNVERYNIFLDGNYSFSVDEEVLARFQLMKGKELSELDITEINYEDEIRKGVNSAIHYLSFRMRSEREVRDYLKQKEYPEPAIQEVIHKLYQLKYINDVEFAIAFVRTQVNTTKKGPSVLIRELKEKGISETNIDIAMKEYPMDAQLSHATALIEKTIKQNQKLSERSLKQKIEQNLLRKGFSGEMIQMAMNEVTIEKDEDQEWHAIIEQGMKAHRKFQKYSGYEYEQKMKQTLYRKGFSIELIDRFINEYEK